ncbi:hypothetical protein NW807_08490 [Synechococcus sp. R70.1]|uniref:hypothetical protein n=1 Tax=Synechococcus sp. R70.1 TaxID=2964531 RepID=UPI0039C0F9EA
MQPKTLGSALKLMVAAAAISAAIKYGGPYLALPKTLPVMVTMIASPAVVMAALLWRWQQRSSLSPALTQDLQGSPPTAGLKDLD